MKKKRQLVPRTRNAATLTEAAYWGKVRSALRNAFRYWKPMEEAKKASRRRSRTRGRAVYEYQCAECKDWFSDKEIQKDHIIPAGSLKSGDDLKGFLERLTPEEGFQMLCKTKCHQAKTNAERQSKRKIS